MDWETARAALDHVASRRAGPLTVEFSGGEPLLERDLLIRCVEYLESKIAEGRRFRIILTTNGTLLTEEDLRFLEVHRIKLHLSFDGPPAAQGFRGPGTFLGLDRLVTRMREDHPSLFRGMRILCAVQEATLANLADSVAYLLSKGVRSLVLYAVVGAPGSDSSTLLERVGAQFARITEDSAAHWEQTGELPVEILRAAPRAAASLDRASACGALRPDGFCVDPDGRTWSCPLFADSLQRLSPMARRASKAFDLGEVHDPYLWDRMEALPRLAESLPFLAHRERKHSGLGRCATCQELAECVICPASISHAPGNDNPDRVPDFVCAFNRAAIGARRAFHSRMGDRIRERQADRIKEALERLNRALLPEGASS